jgi:glutamyl-tRNA reductase
MTPASILTGVTVSHRTAPLSTIEAQTSTAEIDILTQLQNQPGVHEAFVLHTCHRAEAYVATQTDCQGITAIETLTDGLEDSDYELLDHESVQRHLMRVATGLESVVLGENEILGQLKAAHETGLNTDTLGQLLGKTVLKAVHVGERARTETSINDGIVSLGSATNTIASKRLALDATDAVIVGAGTLATSAAHALAETVNTLTIVNRTLSNAETLADELPGAVRAAGLDTLPGVLENTDLLVTATSSPDPIVNSADVQHAGELLVIDLGQPRNVSLPSTPARVELRTLDDLQAITTTTRHGRQDSVNAVTDMIKTELENLNTELKRKRADHVIAGMYKGANVIKSRELETALNRLNEHGDVTPEQEAIVKSLVETLINQLLAAPTESLRDAAEHEDWETIHAAIQLYNPNDPPTDAIQKSIGEESMSRNTPPYSKGASMQ